MTMSENPTTTYEEITIRVDPEWHQTEHSEAVVTFDPEQSYTNNDEISAVEEVTAPTRRRNRGRESWQAIQEHLRQITRQTADKIREAQQFGNHVLWQVIISRITGTWREIGSNPIGPRRTVQGSETDFWITTVSWYWIMTLSVIVIGLVVWSLIVTESHLVDYESLFLGFLALTLLWQKWHLRPLTLLRQQHVDWITQVHAFQKENRLLHHSIRHFTHELQRLTPVEKDLKSRAEAMGLTVFDLVQKVQEIQATRSKIQEMKNDDALEQIVSNPVSSADILLQAREILLPAKLE